MSLKEYGGLEALITPVISLLYKWSLEMSVQRLGANGKHGAYISGLSTLNLIKLTEIVVGVEV